MSMKLPIFYEIAFKTSKRRLEYLKSKPSFQFSSWNQATFTDKRHYNVVELSSIAKS